MRHTASEKMEVIRLVEESDLPVGATLHRLGIAKSTFYGWYERYRVGGVKVLEDRKPKKQRSWNEVSDDVRKDVVDLALERTDMSARQLACHYTDEKRYFLSESSVYRILKDRDLIASPAYELLSAADRFHGIDPLRRTGCKSCRSPLLMAILKL